MREQQILFGLGLLNSGLGFGQPVARCAPTLPCSHKAGAIHPSIPVQKIAVPTRIDEAAIIMLAMQFDQCWRNFAQQRHAHRLIIDKGPATAISLEAPADHQRFARLYRHFGISQNSAQSVRQGRKVETGRHAGLIFARTHQCSLSPIPQNQPQCIEQDRFTCTGFAGQHAQPRPKGKVERFDQHDVAYGKLAKHRYAVSNSSVPVRHRLAPSCSQPGA